MVVVVLSSTCRYTGHGWTWPNSGGPAAGIGFWWAFVGSNAVWVIVPYLAWKQGMDKLEPMIKEYMQKHKAE